MSLRDKCAKKMKLLAPGMKVQPFLSHLSILSLFSDNEEIGHIVIEKALKTVKGVNVYGD